MSLHLAQLSCALMFMSFIFGPRAIAQATSPNPTSTYPHQLTRGQMRVGWRLDGDRITLSAWAPTRGWLLVGFNSRPGLHGARLLFMRLDASNPVAELHRTDLGAYPSPYHKPWSAIGLTADITDISAKAAGQGTLFSCSLPLAAQGTQDVTLSPDGLTHMILAWSAHADFNHHSTWRVGVDLRLNAPAP